MVKIFALADSHFDERSRFDDCVRVHQAFALDVARERPDIVLHGGDLYDGTTTPRERAAVADWVTEVAEHAPMVIVRGNHDPDGEISMLSRLRTRHPVYAVEGAQVECVAGVTIGCLAWPRRAHLLATVGNMGREEANQVAGTMLRNILRSMDRPSILLTHAMIRGSRTSTGQTMVGADFELGVEDLALSQAEVVVAGHIHAAQEWQHGPTTVLYTGSPRAANFGETEAKSYTEIILGDTTTISRRPLPGRQLVTLDVDYSEASPAVENVSGREIRLRYRVPADEREKARTAIEEVAARLLAQGAHSCTTEETVIVANKARAPEVARAVTIVDKIHAYWAARGNMPAAERAERLVNKLRSL
jgi:exonuclease SbcD